MNDAEEEEEEEIASQNNKHKKKTTKPNHEGPPLDADGYEDLLSSRAVLKKTIRPPHAEGSDDDVARPEFKQLVQVHYVARLKDEGRIFVNTREKNEPLEFSVGDQILELVPPGVMLGVKSMGEGEISRMKLASRYAYPSGHPGYNLEPDQDIECEIELLRILDYQKDPPDAAPVEALMMVRRYKKRGNEFFTWGDEYYSKALLCYKEAIRYADALLVEESKPEGTVASEKSPDFELFAEEVAKERTACYNNIATVFEKQGKLKESKEATVTVLLAEPDHLKALVRAARIATSLGEHQEATLAVTRALELDPKNVAARSIYAELKEKIETAKRKEKEAYGGFLKPVVGRPAIAPPATSTTTETSTPSKKEEQDVAVEENTPTSSPVSSRRREKAPPPPHPKLNNPDQFKVRVLDVGVRLCILLAPTVAFTFCSLIWTMLHLAGALTPASR